MGWEVNFQFVNVRKEGWRVGELHAGFVPPAAICKECPQSTPVVNDQIPFVNNTTISNSKVDLLGT